MRTTTMLVVSAVLVAVPLAAALPQPMPRQHPADVALDDALLHGSAVSAH